MNKELSAGVDKSVIKIVAVLFFGLFVVFTVAGLVVTAVAGDKIGFTTAFLMFLTTVVTLSFSVTKSKKESGYKITEDKLVVKNVTYWLPFTRLKVEVKEIAFSDIEHVFHRNDVTLEVYDASQHFVLMSRELEEYYEPILELIEAQALCSIIEGDSLRYSRRVDQEYFEGHETIYNCRIAREKPGRWKLSYNNGESSSEIQFGLVNVFLQEFKLLRDNKPSLCGRFLNYGPTSSFVVHKDNLVIGKTNAKRGTTAFVIQLGNREYQYTEHNLFFKGVGAVQQENSHPFEIEVDNVDWEIEISSPQNPISRTLCDVIALTLVSDAAVVSDV